MAAQDILQRQITISFFMSRAWIPYALKCLHKSHPCSTFKIIATGSPTLVMRAFVSVPAPRVPTTILAADIPIEEELTPGYNPKQFYPVNPGNVFHNRYETITKVGWGSSSTVWLARDLNYQEGQPNRYVVLKVNKCDFPDKEAAEHELDISKHLTETNPSHKGFPLVRTVIDNFEAMGPNGTHMCLVYEPMREPLWLFRQRFKDRKIPLALVKAYLRILLMGLDYLHSECHIVHTDLKLDNILVGFEDPSVLEDFIQAQAENPMPRKIREGRSIYQSQNNFGPLRSLYVLPMITDFGLAQQGVSSELHVHPIQPDHYRAPEVILGTGWSYSADIWNLGVLMWNLIENKDLFKSIHSSTGEYDGRAHLAEMMALLGPPPRELIDRERKSRICRWTPAIVNSKGELSASASEYYGGPYFDSKGEFMHSHLVPKDLNLADSVPSLEGDEKNGFLGFVLKMLQWLPDKRTSAKELLDDPWLLQYAEREA